MTTSYAYAGSRLTTVTANDGTVSTFTFGGLRIAKDSGQVLDTHHLPIPGLYCAGEMVGGLFYFNYPSGTGLVSGAVFGKLAGTAAGQNAKNTQA